MNWIVLPLRRYFDFSGRSRRLEFWAFHLAFALVQGAIMAAFTDGRLVEGANWWSWAGAVSPLGDALAGALFVLCALPMLALAVRRLHDVDRSGFWLLLHFVPGLGSLILLVFSLLDGSVGPNRFGPDPKGRSLQFP